jgi:hypothetical protein
VRRVVYEQQQRESGDQLAVLMLPHKLEDFALVAHARALLEIHRVVALEPPRVRTPYVLRDSVLLRQARRLRFPGYPRLLVLYHPYQYPLSRALLAHHDLAELWYIAPDRETFGPYGSDASYGLLQLDKLAREHATQTLAVDENGAVDDSALRLRMRELGIISHRPFVPARRWGRPF